MKPTTAIPIPPGIRALLFDCDGTLADTMAIHWQAWRETFAGQGRELPMDFMLGLKGSLTPVMVVRYNAAFGASLNVDAVVREKEERAVRGLRRARPIAPVLAVARRHRGQWPMAVVSNGIAEHVHITLEAIGARNWFQAVITADDGVAAKPEPDMYLEAARRLGVPAAECLVFEDGDIGIEAARRAGMPVVDVRPFLVPAGAEDPR